MCGIVGMVNVEDVAEHLIRSLARLEYRGYDSAGICAASNGDLWLQKCRGKVGDLAALLKEASNTPAGLRTGIGHTRWATHGKPSRENAHPQTDCAGKVAVVHNGIIENFSPLRAALEIRGHRFQSETDTETIAHLLEENAQEDMLATFTKVLPMLKGSYALVVLSLDDPDALYFARAGSPLVAGVGEGRHFLASDVPAILPYTRRVVFLDDGDYGVASAKGIRFFRLGKEGEAPKRVQTVDWDAEQAAKGGYDHFMLKEIFEQPRAVADTIGGRLDEAGRVNLSELRLTGKELKEIERIHFVACGTAYYAGLSGLYFFEERLPFFHDDTIASEFRYRDIPLSRRDLLILISQSGETADTLAALRKARERGARTLAICNVVGSTIAREADDVLFTRAGPEIGVASTKAYTSQIVAAYLAGLHLAGLLGISEAQAVRAMTETLRQVPELLSRVLDQSEKIARLAPKYADCQNFLYLGRHLFYPSAMEGALKLKEISYIHAEGYPAGEMKHGPIALIDKALPVVCIAPRGGCYDKMVSNIQEVRAREGRVLAVVTEGDQEVAAQAEEVLTIPDVPEWVAPILVAPHLQLIAYYLAKERGCEIDQPRNLAKSVTVE